MNGYRNWKLGGIAVYVPGLMACASPALQQPRDIEVRKHADRTFAGMDAPSNEENRRADSGRELTLEVPLGQVETRGDMLRATGYASLQKGLTLCQHSADLAARIELSKLVKVEVTE